MQLKLHKLLIKCWQLHFMSSTKTIDKLQMCRMFRIFRRMRTLQLDSLLHLQRLLPPNQLHLLQHSLHQQPLCWVLQQQRLSLLQLHQGRIPAERGHLPRRLWRWRGRRGRWVRRRQQREQRRLQRHLRSRTELQLHHDDLLLGLQLHSLLQLSRKSRLQHPHSRKAGGQQLSQSHHGARAVQRKILGRPPFIR